MKFIVDNKHREFFSTQGWIEFEELLGPEKLHELKLAVDGVLAQRLQMPIERALKLPASRLIHKGHDLWRDNETIKSIVCNRVYAEIASNLVEVTPVRLAYDQILIGASGLDPAAKASLAELSSMQGLLGGLVMALQGEGQDEATREKMLGVCPWPSKVGNGVFLAPETILNIGSLQGKDEVYLLIVYCRAVSRYVISDTDPNTHYLKTFGYSFGDRLVDQHHPVLFR